MICVHALLEIASGRIDEYLPIHQALIPQILEEEGCIEYLLAVDTSTSIDMQRQAGSKVVSVIEKWEDVSALEAHRRCVSPTCRRFTPQRDCLHSRTGRARACSAVKFAMKKSALHVALLVETSNAYCRTLLQGVATYVREHNPWSIYLMSMPAKAST